MPCSASCFAFLCGSTGVRTLHLGNFGFELSLDRPRPPVFVSSLDLAAGVVLQQRGKPPDLGRREGAAAVFAATAVQGRCPSSCV
ncbi:hypothetical protein O6P43_032274 [Quillaja saponaria]|uniref:Uncharacterized protein n=1 Tax=Quillaja saponaria TaxID=32244 RepID=A0AAD7P5F8_QUISA|nr:hypothetical protein O6P43_032274 [Quillaja saponaria]